ncbi:hypothetical protein [Shewanella sp. GD04112]|jgi:hypothetical protein|uniref:hypothetical protein n=1 Tax=Shewanella sp. GD04112 TaxID=2975434 RepID=UPI00244B3776|nr:hypothetical protein [Shewanella sp. GD04112]MDH0451087.1 hypothetical protein [Shewanella sp. GD04112]
MASKLKVETNEYGQTYGTYSYNKELGTGEYILKKHSKRKHYPDVLSRNRTEECILDAIANYKAEIKAMHEEIKRKLQIKLAR